MFSYSKLVSDDTVQTARFIRQCCLIFVYLGICVISQLLEDLANELIKNEFREARDKEFITELLGFL